MLILLEDLDEKSKKLLTRKEKTETPKKKLDKMLKWLRLQLQSEQQSVKLENSEKLLKKLNSGGIESELQELNSKG
jgi:hypothetical protein